MSEQTIQNELYSNNVMLLDKYECLNLGATTIKDLISRNVLKNIKVSQKNSIKKPDVLVIDKDGQVIIMQ